MKDIELYNIFIRIQYAFAWISFIILGFIGPWTIALFLFTYGKDTRENKEKKEDILNMSYQKFIFWYGSIFGNFVIIIIVFFYIFELIKYLF